MAAYLGFDNEGELTGPSLFNSVEPADFCVRRAVFDTRVESRSDLRKFHGDGVECDLIVHHSTARSRSSPLTGRPWNYCTASENPVWLTLVPLVAVTVTFETPGGVPVFGGGV